MAKADLGEKQVCPNCGTKFYDLNRRPATCPKCATAFDPADETVRLKRVKTTRTPTYEADYEDDEAPAKRAVDADSEEGLEEETEDAPELDSDASEDGADVVTEDEEEGRVSADALPPGFSETDEDADLAEDAEGDDEGVPLLEDDEEFPDDDIAEEGDDSDPDNER